MFVKLSKDGFQITHNPFNKTEEIPAYVKSCTFESEYLAGLALFIYLGQHTNSEMTVEQIRTQFHNSIRFTFRTLGITSNWSK